jgi:hypothetical protein
MLSKYDLEWQDEGHESSLLLPSQSTETTFDIPNTEIKRSRKLVITGIALACLLFLGIYMWPGRTVLSPTVSLQQSLVTSLNPQAVEPEEELRGEISEEEFAKRFISSTTLAYTADKIPALYNVQPATSSLDTPATSSLDTPATSSGIAAALPTVKLPASLSTTSTIKARVASKFEEFYVKAPDTTATELAVPAPSDSTANVDSNAGTSPIAAVPTADVDVDTAGAVVVPPVDSTTTIPSTVATTPRLHEGQINCAFKMYKRSALYQAPTGCTIVASSDPHNVVKGKPVFGMAVCTSISLGKFVVDDGRLYNVDLVDEDGSDRVRYVAPGAGTKVYVTASMHMMEFDSNNPNPMHQKFVKMDESERVESIVFEAQENSAPASCDEVYDLLNVKESDRLTSKL